MAKKEEPKRRSLNDRINAVIADNDEVMVAGLTQPAVQPAKKEEAPQEAPSPAPTIQTKKATTIMPKEVFNKLQTYCTESEVPKHRALYLFLIDGLHAAGTISDAEHQHFRDLAALLTTTYEKK